jgi:quercetin dioxygenase-like cupin family protein
VGNKFFKEACVERINTYERFLEQEGLPVITGYSASDLLTVPLKPWKRKGGNGAYINLMGAEESVNAYLCEIPSGKSLLPQRHLYEETIYILRGIGATSIWVDGGGRNTLEWQEGSLFSPPLNTWHQHFNGSDEPVRYIALTRAPVSMNLFHDLDFVFRNDFIFKRRYDGESGYFSDRGSTLEGVDPRPKVWDTNFVSDIRAVQMADDPGRGGLSTNVSIEMSNNIMRCHISDFKGGTYMKAHYHGPGAHLLCLSGEGYSLMWPVEAGLNSQGFERIRIDWRVNTIFSPPGRWFHQNFATGKGLNKFLAFHAEGSAKWRGIGQQYKSRLSIKKGGATVEYEDEDPAIRKLFQEEIARTGAPWGMGKFFPGE